MTENLDNLVLMLKSEDIEIRKLAENYLDKNYDLNFIVYRGINYRTNKPTFELDSNEFKKNGYYYKLYAKDFIVNIIDYPNLWINEEIYDFIYIILKYNESFKQE